MENSKLVEVLRVETADLLEQYLIQTESWAREQVKRNIERRSAYYKLTWDRTWSRKPLVQSAYDAKRFYYQEQKFVHNSPSWYFIPEEFIVRSLKNAKEHYESSLIKLVSRIALKGLNLEVLEVKYSRIGVNIEIVITDGDQTVRAFTIIASGSIQRPHYRYLVK